jgi:hypothetical protein
MPGSLELDSPRTNGLVKALLYCDDHPTHPRWGWWCPVCTPEHAEFVIGNDGFISRDKARRAAHIHEERRGHR